MIQLYNAVSEALFVVGDFSTLMSVSEKPLSKAQCFEDKLDIYMSVIRSLSSFGKFKEGIELCTDVLEQLGETLTINGTNDIYMKEAEDVRKMVKHQSQKDLINLPLITNAKKKVGSLFISSNYIIVFRI